MKWTEISAGELHAAEQRLRVAFGNSADRIVQRINSDPEIAFRMVNCAIGSADKSTTSLNPQWLKAREIMGKNFFGVEEAIRHFGINPSKNQLKALSEIPFSENRLQELKESYVLVAVFPISILDIRNKVERTLFCNHEDAWYNNQKFAKEQGQTNWELVRKTPVPNSTSQTWEDQQKLLSKDEQVPSAQIMVYTIIGHYLASKERLFEHIYVRTSSLDSDGRRVSVGYFDSYGHYGWDSYCYRDLALASLSQKS